MTFCQKANDLLRVDARQAIKKAASKDISNDNRFSACCSKLTSDPAKDLENSDAVKRPSA